MNNCYGKNEDMQQRLLTIKPEIGPQFQVLICVPDTDDAERIDEYIERWLNNNTKNTIQMYTIENTTTPIYQMIGTQTDNCENEYEIYSDENIFVTDYFITNN